MSSQSRFLVVSAPLTELPPSRTATTLGANPSVFPLALSLALPDITHRTLGQYRLLLLLPNVAVTGPGHYPGPVQCLVGHLWYQ